MPALIVNNFIHLIVVCFRETIRKQMIDIAEQEFGRYKFEDFDKPCFVRS